MEKKNAIASSFAFFTSFIFAQLAVSFAVVFLDLIFKIFAITSQNATTFFSTALGYLILTIILDFVLILVALCFNKSINDEQPKNKLKLKKLIAYILVAVLSFALLYPIITLFDSFLGKLGFTASDFSYPLTAQNYFISVLSFVILPAVCEEILFRGVILKGFKKYGKWFSIIMTAVFFTIFHMSINQFVYPLFMGLLLAGIMYKENNIIYCIVVHLINNFIALNISYFGIILHLGHWGIYIIAVLFMLLFIGLLFYLIHKTKVISKEKLSKSEIISIIIVLIIMLILWVIINFRIV